MQTREKYSGGPNFRAACARGEDQKHEGDDAECPPDKGAESRDAQGRTCPALSCHLVSVQTGDDRGCLSGDIHKDRSRGSPVHGPVVDPCKHDDGGYGRHAKGHRKENRHGSDRADSRKDSNEGSDKNAYETIEKVQRLENDAKS